MAAAAAETAVLTLTVDQPKVKGEAVFQVLLWSVTCVSPEEAELLTSGFHLQKKKLWPTRDLL